MQCMWSCIYIFIYAACFYSFSPLSLSVYVYLHRQMYTRSCAVVPVDPEIFFQQAYFSAERRMHKSRALCWNWLNTSCSMDSRSDPIRYYLSISFLMKKQVANGHTSITNSYHGIEWAAQALCAVLRFQEAEARSDGVMASYTWHGCNVDCAQLRFGRIYDLCTDLQTS